MELCLGTVQFGLNYGISTNSQPDKQECFNILDHAMQNGINIFDTAKGYGTSEQILGKYLKNKNRSSFKIATKFSKITGTLCEFEEEINFSLKNLNLNYVDFYLLHKVESLKEESAFIGLKYLKEKGLIKKCGISVYSPEEAIEAVNSPYIDCIQVPYNVIDRRLDKVGFFKIAKEKNKIVFCRSILLQGLLLMPKEVAEQKVKNSGAIIDDYHKLCKRFNVTPLQFASAYIKQKEEIDYCIFGVDNLEQLKNNIELQRYEIPKKAIFEADELFADVNEYILDPRQWAK